jgi:hypothetical protein
MKRTAEWMAFFVLAATIGVATDAESADKYANYYEGKRALDRNDCDAAVDYLNVFLRNHPYIREQYPDFYLEIKLVMGQCQGTIRASGVEGESSGIDPLPDQPPMKD